MSALSRRSSIDRINNRYTGPSDNQFAIRDSSFPGPPTQWSQQAPINPPSAVNYYQPSYQQEVFEPDRKVRFESNSINQSQPGGSGIGYNSGLPPIGMPVQNYNPVVNRATLPPLPNHYSGVQNYQDSQSSQTRPMTMPVGIQQPSTLHQERHTIVTNSIDPRQYQNPSILQTVVAVPTMPLRTSQLRNSTMGGSMANPMYSVAAPMGYGTDDQYLQRPPNLSYINRQQPSKCPIWIWVLLGTLAVIGIFVTLYLVGKKRDGHYKIQKSQAQTEQIKPIVETPSSTPVQKIPPPQVVENVTMTPNQPPLMNLPPLTNYPNYNPSFGAAPHVMPPMMPLPNVPRTDNDEFKGQLIKQQNSTIINQQVQLDTLKGMIQALRTQKQLERLQQPLPTTIQKTRFPTTIQKTRTQTQIVQNTSSNLGGVISNPQNVSTKAEPLSAVDNIQCQAGYYPYGGICFPCKNGYWNGTNCMQYKSTNKPVQSQTTVSYPQKTCEPGSFFRSGKCNKCPQGTSWNGQNCVRDSNVRPFVPISKSDSSSDSSYERNPNSPICEQGQFLNSGRCTKCPEGLYWDGKGCFQKHKRRRHLLR